MSHDTKLAYQANQMSKFFAHQPPDKAVDSIVDHILKYWDPRMRKAIVALKEESGGAGFDAPVLKAVEKIREHDARKAATATGG